MPRCVRSATEQRWLELHSDSFWGVPGAGATFVVAVGMRVAAAPSHTTSLTL